VASRWCPEEAALGSYWCPEEAARPVMSRVVSPSCSGGGGVEEPTAEEAATMWRSRPRWVAVGGGVEEPATPGRGGARAGADYSWRQRGGAGHARLQL
jgi:hypothetical protein